jgi:hypothetical protein
MKLGGVTVATGLVAAQMLIGWFVFLHVPSLSVPPRPEPLSPPACILDGGRPLHTLLLTFCIPTDAKVATQDGADTSTHNIDIPRTAASLQIVTGGLIIAEEYVEEKDAPWVLGPPSEKPSTRPRKIVSVCQGFHVVDARWTRPDGLRARVLITLGAWAEYGWVRPSDAVLFDEVLDNRLCEGILPTRSRGNVTRELQ